MKLRSPVAETLGISNRLAPALVFHHWRQLSVPRRRLLAMGECYACGTWTATAGYGGPEGTTVDVRVVSTDGCNIVGI